MSHPGFGRSKMSQKKVDSIKNVFVPNHYKEGPVETIEILESIVSSENRKLTPKQKFCVAQAVRYLLRAGLKGTEEDTLKDLQKADNYVHRALTGSWIDPEFFVKGKK